MSTDDTTAKASQEQDAAAIRMAAMNLLARREHSREELRQKLGRRFQGAPGIDEQLQRLRDDRLQSDQRFAEAILRQRIQGGHGPLRIRQELRHKGVADELVAEVMAAADCDWVALARAALQRKFGAERATEIKEKARRNRFMQARGFASGHFRDFL